MPYNNHNLQQLEDWILMVKKADPESLVKLRHQLGKTRKEIAGMIGVSQQQLMHWEQGKQQPSSKHLALWKIKLSDCIDERISMLIGTNNSEVITHFWEVMWRLND